MKPNRSNQHYCPACGFKWEFCDCEQSYPEQMLIELDDQMIMSAIDFEV